MLYMDFHTMENGQLTADYSRHLYSPKYVALLRLSFILHLLYFSVKKTSQ